MESSEDDVISLYPLDFSSDEERFAFTDVKDTDEETLIGKGLFEDDHMHVVPVNTARQKETTKCNHDGKKAVSGVFLATLSDEELEKMSIQDFNNNNNENGKKMKGLISKKTTLHLQHTFLVHFFANCFARLQPETS